tara:strand:- start:3893 stop:4912 length:1020 start_codon:yes stop_codon:yes gene_type:complete
MKTNFKAAVLKNFRSKLDVLNIPLKNPEKNQILVKLKYSGICRSQLMEIDGKRENKKWLPHLLGHEGSGVVLKVGKNVKGFKLGDKVFLSWIKKNNRDCSNISYSYKKIKINAGKVTTFCSHSIVSANRVYHLPKSVNFKVGALLGCAFPTGFGMVLKSISKKKKIKLLIVGLGGIGLSSLIAAIILNYKNIDILENKKIKINFIKNIIKNKNINFYSNHILIKENYYDNVIETSGNEKILSKSLNFIHNRGKVIFASHPHSKSKMKINPHDLIKGKKIIGSWGGNIKFNKDIGDIVKIINQSKSINKLFTNKIYNLNQINLAIKDFQKGKVIRPLIKF